MLSAKHGGRVETVKIVRAKKGEAPDTANRVVIDRTGDRYEWTGNVDSGGEAVFGASPAEFPTAHLAEADAIAWAMSHGATELMIETDDA
jgi:hypothetical protein